MGSSLSAAGLEQPVSFSVELPVGKAIWVRSVLNIVVRLGAGSTWPGGVVYAHSTSASYGVFFVLLKREACEF